MFLSHLILTLLSLFLQTTLCYPSPSPGRTYPVSVVHQFPLGSWVENLAVRSTNGHILATLLTSPEIYSLNPFAPSSGPVLVTTLPSVLGGVGIVELEPDVFYVGGGNWTIADENSVKGSYAIWEVNLSSGPEAQTRQIAAVPQALALNGLCVVNREKGILYLADSFGYVIYRLNVYTGHVDVALQDPLMNSTTSTPGVNGVHVRFEAGQRVLYYTNSQTGAFVRTPITSAGDAAGPAHVVLSDLEPDDFTLAADGSAYVAENTKNKISVVRPNSGTAALVSSDVDLPILMGPSSCTFGKTRADRGVLYVSVTGGIPEYVSGNFTIGGSVLRIDVGGAEGGLS